MQKKKVGIFSLTCDEGCSIYMIEIFNKKLLGWLEKMEIKYFLSIKERVEIKDFDICLVEGVVTTERDKTDIERIRANTKVLIAMGTCAMTAQPSGMRQVKSGMVGIAGGQTARLNVINTADASNLPSPTIYGT